MKLKTVSLMVIIVIIISTGVEVVLFFNDDVFANSYRTWVLLNRITFYLEAAVLALFFALFYRNLRKTA